jgi:hypothetical protein
MGGGKTKHIGRILYMSTLEDDFDFGFTTVSEEVITIGQKELNTQLQLLYNAIIPLLKNLQANPDKEYILWPNRLEKVKEFKAKIDSIVGDAVTKKKL